MADDEPTVRYAVEADTGTLNVDGPGLTLDLTPGWAVFRDQTGIAYALAAAHVHSIERLDDEPPAATEETTSWSTPAAHSATPQTPNA